MTEQHKENLRKLIALLKTVPDERFYCGLQDLSCGTTACALGWATQIPEFNLEIFKCHASCPIEKGSQSDGSYDAIVNVFGNESTVLFIPGEDHELNFTANDVAAKMESFLAKLPTESA